MAQQSPVLLMARTSGVFRLATRDVRIRGGIRGHARGIIGTSCKQEGLMIRITVDIGGTFTDVVGFDEETGQLLLGKSMSTPQNLVTGIFDAIAGSGSSLPETSLLIHGSTVVINAVLERKGARTALITTKGFRDSLRDRPDQPAGFVQPQLPQAPAADSRRAVLRARGAHQRPRARSGIRSMSGRPMTWRGSSPQRTSSRSRSSSCTRTEVGSRDTHGGILL